MEALNGNGSRPVAVSASGLRKQYSLGSLHSLQQTVNRLVHPRSRQAGPQLEALAGVDFATYRGEAMGIVGKNGSGKSTLLQMLAGTVVPTGGEMRVYGRVLPLLAVGLGFHTDLSGRENVTLFASSLGIPRKIIEERMDAVSAFAGIETHMDTPVKRFSSGMVSRLSFAIAVQFPADIYVFDEVLAVVDSEYEARCLGEIKQLHQSGRTVFFVSHHREQVEAVCERVMWLEKGRIRGIGPAASVLDEYERAHGAVAN